jgi:hypothetical protein
MRAIEHRLKDVAAAFMAHGRWRLAASQPAIAPLHHLDGDRKRRQGIGAEAVFLALPGDAFDARVRREIDELRELNKELKLSLE